jgi:hypothetical protein
VAYHQLVEDQWGRSLPRLMCQGLARGPCRASGALGALDFLESAGRRGKGIVSQLLSRFRMFLFILFFCTMP